MLKSLKRILKTLRDLPGTLERLDARLQKLENPPLFTTTPVFTVNPVEVVNVGCQHEYDLPYIGDGHPPCKKCGYMPSIMETTIICNSSRH